MPWQSNGTFLRINPDFSGPIVWQEDQQASYKVIASRHDIHDQDLAVGISNALNLDGYNAMRANINAGGYRVVNMIDGVGSTDAATVAQLDEVKDQVNENTADIAAIQTSDPDSIITAMNFTDAKSLVAVRTNGNFTVPLKKFEEFKASKIIRHLGIDLTAAAVTPVNTQAGNRFYMYNNLTGTMQINIIRPTGTDPELGQNYFTEGLIIIENGATPALPQLQGDGVAISPSSIIGSPTLNAGTRYTLSYSIQRTTGNVYREAYIWSTA
jgi:hypothetical protein